MVVLHNLVGDVKPRVFVLFLLRGRRFRTMILTIKQVDMKVDWIEILIDAASCVRSLGAFRAARSLGFQIDDLDLPFLVVMLRNLRL